MVAVIGTICLLTAQIYKLERPGKYTATTYTILFLKSDFTSINDFTRWPVQFL